MKQFFQLQYKTRIALSLTLLILVILINNIGSRRNLDHANVSVASIYNDRLLVSTYIFELTNHLYEKKILSGLKSSSVASSHAHDAAIHNLMEKYEATTLTQEEMTNWTAFKTNLGKYDASVLAGQQESVDFEHAVQNLKNLSDIQANEGNQLFNNTRSDISASAMGTHLEIGFAILLGIFSLVLIGVSKNTLSAFRQNPSLN